MSKRKNLQVFFKRKGKEKPNSGLRSCLFFVVIANQCAHWWQQYATGILRFYFSNLQLATNKIQGYPDGYPCILVNDCTTSQNKRIVTLTINEPLPGLKELTAAVEDHWISMIHKAIFEESRTGIPKFNKAFVMIEITTPRGSNNPKVWDTSNRAIKVIINNLKGISFKDDDFEHMACGIVANWGENGRTIIRICELEDLLGSVVFGAKNENL